MAYMCKICNANPVQYDGQVCDNCKDPYSDVYGAHQVEPGKGAGVRRVLIGNDRQEQTENSITAEIPVVQPANQPTVIPVNTPITQQNTSVTQQNTKASPLSVSSTSSTNNDGYLVEGIVRNYKEEIIKSFFIEKWFKSFFQGSPFTLDETVHVFQVYQSYSVNNTGSPICDEVRIYGKITNGQIYQDNVVRVWGKRNSSNVIIAKKVLNAASGTSLSIHYGISAAVVRIITFLLLAFISAEWFGAVSTGRTSELLVKFFIAAFVIGIIMYVIKKIYRIFKI